MPAEPLALVVRYVRRLVDVENLSALSDVQLLERFTAQEDGAAFAGLVDRYGRLVWDACRRLLANTQDAEDAFQATFLVLARRAKALDGRGRLGGWLYTVAYHLALKTRAEVGRRREHEQRAATMATGDPQEVVNWEQVRSVLDEELHRLPKKYRLVLVLCYLQGKTNAQAAAELGWPIGSMSRRLSRARALLRAGLARRGVGLATGLLGAALGNASAAVPGTVAAAAVRAALAFGPGPGLIGGATSTRAVALAETFLKGVLMAKAKVLSVVLVAAGLITGAIVAPQALSVQDETRPAIAVQPSIGTTNNNVEALDGPATLAARVWAIMDAVRKNHLEPPADKEMVLASAQGFAKTFGTSPPADLPRRIETITRESQLAALFRDLWPREVGNGRDGKVEAAVLEGLFGSIPGRPVLFPETQLKLFEQLRANRYVGIGVQLGKNEKEQFPTFAIPFRRGAARKAGVMPGDLILEIDGRNTGAVLDLEKVALWLRGLEGTSVTVVVRQPGSAKPRTLTMVRAPIPIDSVLGYRRAGEDGWNYWADREAGIGYLWVNAIKSSTLHELRQAERRLRADGIRALVLDFRFSEGEGDLHDTALLADGLLDGGLMWSVQGTRDKVTEYRADREALFRDWPLVVLMNDTQANVQGLVLAALQDNARATLIGETTKNDGMVRSIFHLPDNRGAITVVTGRLKRAAKDRGWPVRPDHAVELGKEQRTIVQKWLLDKQLPELPPGQDDRAPADPQLDRALSILRESLKTKDKS